MRCHCSWARWRGSDSMSSGRRPVTRPSWLSARTSRAALADEFHDRGASAPRPTMFPRHQIVWAGALDHAENARERGQITVDIGKRRDAGSSRRLQSTRTGGEHGGAASCPSPTPGRASSRAFARSRARIRGLACRTTLRLCDPGAGGCWMWRASIVIEAVHRNGRHSEPWGPNVRLVAGRSEGFDRRRCGPGRSIAWTRGECDR